MQRAVRQLIVGASLIAVTVVGFTGIEAVKQAQGGSIVPEAEVSLASDTVTDELSRAFRRASKQALPGVVYIEVEAVRNARVEVPDPFRGTPWEDLFRPGDPSPRPRMGEGSGFVFRSDGYILTNNHVVEGAEHVRVVLQDRREFEAKVVGRDPNTDVAVLKIDAKGLPVVALGNSDAMAVGDWVVALGYPLHLGATVTAGIVSAKGRNLELLRRSEEASAPLENFIQTDAAINPGNSGGPLVDLEGRAIGMSTAISSPTGYFSGYGFAVPITLVSRVAEDLIRHGEVRRPKLGVGIEGVRPADAEVYGLDSPSGVQVTRVESGSPAERAGIHLGDVVVAMDGQPVSEVGHFMERLARKQPGERVRLDLVRYGERAQVEVELAAFEPAVRARQSETKRPETGLDRLGFTATELTPDLARRLGLAEARGVVIMQVTQSGAAARAGLAQGMVIERLNGSEVAGVRELERAAEAVRPGQAVSLIVRLPDGSRTIVNYRIAA